MMPHGAYEDGELEISLAPSANRRAQNKPPDASGRRALTWQQEHRSVEPVPQKKAEQRIGAYHIIRTLGEGSFGKVKLAYTESQISRWPSRSLRGRSSSAVIWLAGSSGKLSIYSSSDILISSSCMLNYSRSEL